MAVFLVNNCAFKGCKLTFPTLADLIQHIEDTHLETDPKILEKQENHPPPSVALSYVLKFYTDAARKENAELSRKRVRAQSPAVSLPESSPTGSEVDDEEMESIEEDSNDSWTLQEEITSEKILSMVGCKDTENGDKPFCCPIPGCKKRYKNVNGIKYHARHGHKKEQKVKKSYKCHCGKSYKFAVSMRNHVINAHSSGELSLPMVSALSQGTLGLGSSATHTSPGTISSCAAASAIIGSSGLQLKPGSLSVTPPKSLSQPAQFLDTLVLPPAVSKALQSAGFTTPTTITSVGTVFTGGMAHKAGGRASMTMTLGTPIHLISQTGSLLPVSAAASSPAQLKLT